MRLASKQKQAREQRQSGGAGVDIPPSEGAALDPGNVQSSAVTLSDMTVATRSDTTSAAFDAQFTITGPMTDTHFLVLTDMTAAGALTAIAQLLNLDCQLIPGFHIQASAEGLPPPIAPTQLQRKVPHQPYLDMLPWASLRDRLLKSISVINEGEIVLAMQAGCFKVWGSIAWDPMGWEVDEEFAKRWWFLMGDDIIRTTNFWRSQRGEMPLTRTSPE